MEEKGEGLSDESVASLDKGRAGEGERERVDAHWERARCG